MFSQVYWQHTVRALKAMLAYVLRRALARLTSEESSAYFWECFDQVFFEETRAAASLPAAADSEDLSSDPKWFANSHLSMSDDSVLEFLWEFSDESGKRMISAIRSRTLYRRLDVLSGSRKDSQDRYNAIYELFSGYRTQREWAGLESYRKSFEEQLITASLQKLEADKRLLPKGTTFAEVESGLRGVEPLILIDVPIKGADADASAFRFLPEEHSALHSRNVVPFPRSQEAPALFGGDIFDRQVGKIRAFAHPDWCKLLTRTSGTPFKTL